MSKKPKCLQCGEVMEPPCMGIFFSPEPDAIGFFHPACFKAFDAGEEPPEVG